MADELHRELTLPFENVERAAVGSEGYLGGGGGTSTHP